MSYSVGDGMVALSVAGGIVGYLYLKHQSQQKKIEVLHRERMAAMDKGIPLPEFPSEQEPERYQPDPDNVIPLLGIMLSTLSVGAMIVLALTLAGNSRSFWIAPLPFAFLGIGLIGFHFLQTRTGR